jgi:hypothetical protein
MKAVGSIHSRVGGKAIDRNDESANDSDSIRFNDDGDSNEIDSRSVQDEKQFEQRISTDDGMTIDRNDEFANDCDSIRSNDDGDSNEIDSRRVQKKKQFEQRISTLRGIIIFAIERIFRINILFSKS